MINLKDNEGVELLSTNLTLTDTWQTVGSVFCMMDITDAALLFKVDINDSLNFRYRFLFNTTLTDTSNYLNMIQTVSSSDIKLDQEYFELNADADTNFIHQLTTMDICPYVTLQVKVGTVGATAGILTSCKIVIKTIGA